MNMKTVSFFHAIFKKQPYIKQSPIEIKHVKTNALPGKRHPYFFRYRSSDFYISLTASLSIFASIYLNPSILIISSYIIEYHFRNNQPQLTSSISLISTEWMDYILSGAYLLGLLVGSVLFGWIGYHTNQRRIPMFLSSTLAIGSCCALMMANRYWIILVSKFFQGFSNCSTWLMSFAMISDRWPRQKLGLMVGLIGCLFPLGLSLGSIVSAFYYYVSYQALLYSVLTVGIMPCLLQIMVIEKTSTLEEWLQPEQNTSSIQGELELKALSYTRTMPETAGKWSKSSSMSTINLNQPPVFEKEMKDTMTLSFKESIFFCLLSSGQFMSLLYQIVAISIIVGTLKSALLLELENHLNIINAFSQSVMTGTFLLPCTVSAFVSGWLCDRFEPKNISLTSVIICVSAFIWIGVPNQNVQSIASALVFSGTTLAALAASTLVTTINIMQQIVFRYYNMRQDIIREQRTSTPIAATVCFTSGIGFFTGIFIKNLTDVIGFFWLCFSLGMLLLTCIPWMLLFAEPKEKAKSMEDIIVFSQSSSKKSIIHSIRPESFAESILSDTEDEEAQEDESTADNFIKSLNSKPVMVAP